MKHKMVTGARAMMLIAMVCLAFAACDTHSIPSFSDDSRLVPFRVEEISEAEFGMSYYYGTHNAAGNITFSRPVVMLPTGMFNIGDTIKPSNFKK